MKISIEDKERVTSWRSLVWGMTVGLSGMAMFWLALAAFMVVPLWVAKGLGCF